MMPAVMPASSAVPGILAHNPLSPIGQSATISPTGNSKAVETERIEACTGFSIAETKLWVAKLNQRVI